VAEEIAGHRDCIGFDPWASICMFPSSFFVAFPAR